MMSFGKTDQDISLLLESERLKSFEDWPNDRSWFCTPEKLAKAGFFFKPEGECLDNVCCAFCRKELDGWEPDDDPLSEHRKHSAKCPFLTQQTPIEDLTLEALIRLIGKIKLFITEQTFDKMKKTMEEESNAARDMILSKVNH